MGAWIAAIVAIALGTAFGWDAGAQHLYRWVDKDGRVHYSQQPPPRGAAKSVQQRSMGSPVVESSTPSFALQQAMKNFPVTIYTAPNCKEGCIDGKELLTKRGVPFREIVVTTQVTSDALKKATGDNKVPAFVIGSTVQVGYVPQTLQNTLDTAGYPKAPAFTGKAPELPPIPGLWPPEETKTAEGASPEAPAVPPTGEPGTPAAAAEPAAR